MSSEPERRDEPPPASNGDLLRKRIGASLDYENEQKRPADMIEGFGHGFVAGYRACEGDRNRVAAAALVERERELAEAVELLRDALPRLVRTPAYDSIQRHEDGLSRVAIGRLIAAYDARRAPAPAAPAKGGDE